MPGAIELEQTRKAAEWRDAEAAEKARAESKAEPKRSHVAAHDEKLDDARHRLKVETLAEDRAFNALQAALDDGGDEWAESIEQDDARRSRALARPATTHGRTAPYAAS